MTVATLVPSLATALALVVAAVSLAQKTRADRRSEWWRRVQWTVEQATSDDPDQRRVGLVTMLHLVDSPLATTAEKQLFRDVCSNLIERRRR